MATKKPKKEKARPVVTAAYINKCGVYEAEIRQVCIRLLGARPLDAFRWSAKEKTEFFLENIQAFAEADLGLLDKNYFTDASLIFLAQLQEYVGGVGDSLPTYLVSLEEKEVPTGVTYSPEETWEVDEDEDEAEPEEEDLVDISQPVPVKEAEVVAVTAEEVVDTTEKKEKKMPPIFKRASLGAPTKVEEPAEKPAEKPVEKAAAKPAEKAAPKPAEKEPEVVQEDTLDPLVSEVATLREAVAGLTATVEQLATLVRAMAEGDVERGKLAKSTSLGLMALINATIVPAEDAPIEDMAVFLEQ